MFARRFKKLPNKDVFFVSQSEAARSETSLIIVAVAHFMFG